MKVAQLRSYCVALRVESFELRGTDDAATAAAHKASESESLGMTWRLWSSFAPEDCRKKYPKRSDPRSVSQRFRSRDDPGQLLAASEGAAEAREE